MTAKPVEPDGEPQPGTELAIPDESVSQGVKAKKRYNRMVRDLTRAANDFVDAVEEEDWRFMNFSNIEEWRASLFNDIGRLTPAARKEIVKKLAVTGQTLRKIAEATGASAATVMRDLRESGVSDETQAGTQPDTQLVSSRQEAARQREEQRRQDALAEEDRRLSDELAVTAFQARLEIYAQLRRLRYVTPEDFLTLFDEDLFQGRTEEAATILSFAVTWIQQVQDGFDRERQILRGTA